MKKIHYDVLQKEGNDFKSKFFTVEDFIEILKHSFMSHDDYAKKVYSDVPFEHRSHFMSDFHNFHLVESFPFAVAKLMEPIINNDKNKIQYANLFKYKVLNFNSVKRIMFDFYVNKQTNLLLNPDEESVLISNKNEHIEKGVLFIRVYNYGTLRGLPNPDPIDINTKINVNYGLIDNQMRAVPWFVDQWVNQHELKLDMGEVYIMSPLLHHCIKIYDKILLLSKQRRSYISPSLLKNAIDASFNDARITLGMNQKYRLINNSFIRVIPCLLKYTGTEIKESSRFFDFINQQNKANVFSYSDVVTNGSGVLGSNKIDLDDYQRAVFDLGIYDIMFTKEENTNHGLFSWVNPKFADVINSYDKSLLKSDLSVLNNHVITIDYDLEEYVTSINGPEPMIALTSKKKNAQVKKSNQRFKHANSRTFLYDGTDSFNKSMIMKEFNKTGYYFRRDVNYLNNSKVIEETSYTRNGLVAFVSADVHLPAITDFVDMTIDQINKWFKTLRGVACEGFFSKEFLRQRMIVHRTRRLKCALEDTSESFQALVANPEGTLNRIIPSFDKDKFFVRNYKDCLCEGKIINDQCKACGNPRPVDNELKTEYWVEFEKGFDFAKLTGIQMVEDGINMYLEYSIPLVNSRLKCEELTKSVSVETAQSDLGYLTHLRCGDIDIDDLKVPLDGVYFGLGGFKSKIHGIPFTVLRLYNALKSEIYYSSEDCVNETQLVNEFLSNFKKSVITTKVYDVEIGAYVNKSIEAWVGLVAISPTEVSQEFNKSRFEDERSFGKANYALNDLLGFEDLNKALSEESNLFNNRSTEFRDELFKIANIHSSVRPSFPETKKAEQKAIKHDNLLKGIINLTKTYIKHNDLFNVTGLPKYSLREFVTRVEYLELISKFPLFTDSRFEKGFYIVCSLNVDKKQAVLYNGFGVLEHAIYFPKRSTLMQMFEIIGDNNVRINGLLNAYINVFETLAVSRLGSSDKTDNRSNVQLINKGYNNRPHQFDTINGKILKETNNLLFDKEGILNQITNIALPRIMSKQLTCIDCPYDVAIVASNYQFKKIVSKTFDNLYPDRKQDWTTPFVNVDTGEVSEIGWCWLEDVYGTSIREPNLFSKQNLNVKKIWSSFKADEEYKKMTGMTFMQKHPGTKGIYLNPVFVAFNLEGDVDGDTIFLAIPYTTKAQVELSKVYDLIKDMSFFDKENTNPKAKLVRDTYLVPSLKYLRDEAENLNFELETLSIGYSRISFADSLRANFEASRNKENIGFLTVSLWHVTYFIDFYMFNYERLVEKGYKIPLLTDKDKYELLFIFQYLLAQQNGVRAMKDDGYYGKITLDSLVVNKVFEEDQPPARTLLANLINEYKEETAKENIDVDFSDSLKKFYNILDMLFVSSGKFKGFGYMLAVDGTVFSFRDEKWTYGEKDNVKQKRDVIYYNCTDRYDSYFVDFFACFLLINGRNADIFIDKFGYDKTLESLDFEHKPHLHSPLLSFAKDVFIK
jgi:hypothetical protein